MKNHLTALLRNNIGLLALLFVSFLVYVPSLSGDFVVDDIPIIRDNPYIRDSSHLASFFSTGLGANSALEDNSSPIYRPLVLVVISLGHGLWGNNPAGYHLALLLLHLANALLVYVLIRKLAAGSAMAATVGAAMFALHPTRVESVAWLSGINDPLVVFFLLAALLAHQTFAGSQKKWRYLALSLFCFQLALWSKEVAIFFPLVVVAHDLIYRRKINWLATSLHTVLVVGYLIARTLALGASGKWNAFDLSRFPRAVDLTLGYSELLVFPAQVPFYIQPPEHSVSSALGWIGAITIVTLAGFSWRAFDQDRRKALALAAIWTIGFSWQAVLLMFYLDGYYSARFLYVPAVGIAVFTAVFYDYLSANCSRLKTLIAASCLLIISCYGAVTWKEIPVWHNNETIYRKVTEMAPESAEGFNGLGHFYLAQDDYAAAEKNFLIALQKAKTPQARVNSLEALGTLYGMNNNLAQSERYLREAVQIEPRNSEAWAGLGNLAWVKGQVSEAISCYEKALAIRPGNYEAAMNLAMAYEKSGQAARGALVRRSIRQQP